MSTLNLLPIALDLQVTRGTTRSIQFTFTSNGSPVNLTGDTVTLTVKTSQLASGAEVYALDVTVHTDAANGITTVTIPKSATFGTDGSMTTFYYELRLIESGGSEFVWWAGILEVHPTGAPL